MNDLEDSERPQCATPAPITTQEPLTTFPTLGGTFVVLLVLLVLPPPVPVGRPFDDGGAWVSVVALVLVDDLERCIY